MDAAVARPPGRGMATRVEHITVPTVAPATLAERCEGSSILCFDMLGGASRAFSVSAWGGDAPQMTGSLAEAGGGPCCLAARLDHRRVGEP